MQLYCLKLCFFEESEKLNHISQMNKSNLVRKFIFPYEPHTTMDFNIIFGESLGNLNWNFMKRVKKYKHINTKICWMRLSNLSEQNSQDLFFLNY